MKTESIGERLYELDSQGFLLNHEQWDEDFAREMAAGAGIKGGLTDEHWDVIHFIRDFFAKEGKCPLIYEACRSKGLALHDLKKLFPSGYLRGACRLAGISYREGYVKYAYPRAASEKAPTARFGKAYEVDSLGFLNDASEWDDRFAVLQAHEMKIEGGLTGEHWKLIGFLRDYYNRNQVVPTVYEFCESNHLEIDELEKLFPGGYHRCAVKMAGLKAR